MNKYQVICHDEEIHGCFWNLARRYAQQLDTLKIEMDEVKNNVEIYVRLTFLENQYSETFRNAAEMLNTENGWLYGNGV